MLVILSDPDPELAEGEGESKNPLSSWGYGSFGAPLRGLLRMTEEGRGCVLLLVILSDPDPELAEGEGESKNPLSLWGYGSFDSAADGCFAQDDRGETRVRRGILHDGGGEGYGFAENLDLVHLLAPEDQGAVHGVLRLQRNAVAEVAHTL